MRNPILPLPTFAACTLALAGALAGCSRTAPQAGEPAAAPTAPPSATNASGASGSHPAETVPPSAPAIPATPGENVAVPPPPVSPVPMPQQHEAMAYLVEDIQAKVRTSRNEGAAVEAREAAQRQAQYKAALADYEVRRAEAEREIKAMQEAERVAWEKKAADYRAVLADPSASETDKAMARAKLAAGFVPFNPPPTTIPAVPAPPSASLPWNGEPAANQTFDVWVYRFRQAVESRDHAQAQAAMEELAKLTPRVSPPQVDGFLIQARRYLQPAEVPATLIVPQPAPVGSPAVRIP